MCWPQAPPLLYGAIPVRYHTGTVRYGIVLYGTLLVVAIAVVAATDAATIVAASGGGGGVVACAYTA